MAEEHGKVALCEATLPLFSFWYHVQASEVPTGFWLFIIAKNFHVCFLLGFLATKLVTCCLFFCSFC